MGDSLLSYFLPSFNLSLCLEDGGGVFLEDDAVFHYRIKEINQKFVLICIDTSLQADN